MKSVVSSVPLLEDRLSEENFVFTSSEGVVDVSASLLSLDAVLSKKDDSSSFSEMNDLVDATFRNITSSAVTCGGTTVVNLEDDLKDSLYTNILYNGCNITWFASFVFEIMPIQVAAFNC